MWNVGNGFFYIGFIGIENTNNPTFGSESLRNGEPNATASTSDYCSFHMFPSRFVVLCRQ
jgi:hypothetical protein